MPEPWAHIWVQTPWGRGMIRRATPGAVYVTMEAERLDKPPVCILREFVRAVEA